MTEQPSRISDAESTLMQVLWDRGEATADEVFRAVAEQSGWQEATVKTLLNRLLRKRAIAADREGRRYRYRPILQRSDYLAEQSRSLVDRLFGGRVAPLVAHFNEHRALSRSDLEELRQLIRELDDEQ